jgi:hypothetical protein
MALSLERALLVRERTRRFTRKPKIQSALKAFFSYIDQHKRDIDLQFVAFSALDDSETVIADAACKVYATYMRKGSGSTVTTFVKETDSATTSSDASSEFRFELAEVGAQEEIVIYFDGAAMASGVTMQGNTTANGGTAAVAVDAVSGFVIIGAP